MTVSTPTRRRMQAMVMGGIVFLSAACFWAGRLSVPPAVSHAPDNGAGPSANVGASAGVPAAVVIAGIQTNGTSRAASGWDETQWQMLLSQPGTRARNGALAAMLEKLAALDPDRA